MVESYLLLLLLIFAINVIPAFMPPTWVVLSFLFIQYHLLFWPTVILGVIGATSGRVVLALLSRKFESFLPEKLWKNYAELGELLKSRQSLTIPVVLGYAFSPVSSNSLFIIAGLSNLRLDIIAFSFFVGRVFTYSFWITASHQIGQRLEDIFSTHFTSINTLISALFSLLVIIVVGKIKWGKLFKKG